MKLYSFLRALLDFLRDIGILKQRVPFDPKDLAPKPEDPADFV